MYSPIPPHKQIAIIDDSTTESDSDHGGYSGESGAHRWEEEKGWEAIVDRDSNCWNQFWRGSLMKLV